MPKRHWRAIADRRRRLYEILEHGTIGDQAGTVVARLIVGLIVVNLVAVTLESLRNLNCAMERCSWPSNSCRSSFLLSSTDCGYGFRSTHAPYRHLSPLKARLKFITTPFGIIDLLAVLPFWLAFSTAVRRQGPAGIPDDSLSQACPIFARHAFAARRALR